jgi:hypothetical protein
MPRYYVPSVHSTGPTPDVDLSIRKGVGLPSDRVNISDVDLVQAEWYYDWACTTINLKDSRYVPMSWSGAWQLPLHNKYSGYLLALNEPDNAGQLNITPSEAAKRVKTLAGHYPAARLIVGGPSYFGKEWLIKFVEELGDYKPAGWHIHGYCEWSLTAQQIIQWFTEARAICKWGELWITEFADVGYLGEANKLLDFVKNTSWISRYAWFASRLTGQEWYFPKHWKNPTLIQSDSTLSFIGKIYKGV